MSSDSDLAAMGVWGVPPYMNDPGYERSPMAGERVRLEHFGDDHHGGHVPIGDFDFYCVAHGEDYSPKYMAGEVCHDGTGEGFCNDRCRRCPRPCPIKPCPLR